VPRVEGRSAIGIPGRTVEPSVPRSIRPRSDFQRERDANPVVRNRERVPEQAVSPPGNRGLVKVRPAENQPNPPSVRPAERNDPRRDGPRAQESRPAPSRGASSGPSSSGSTSASSGSSSAGASGALSAPRASTPPRAQAVEPKKERVSKPEEPRKDRKDR
jgi:hypothetical protein